MKRAKKSPLYSIVWCVWTQDHLHNFQSEPLENSTFMISITLEKVSAFAGTAWWRGARCIFLL